jgi:hypothetical protein
MAILGGKVIKSEDTRSCDCLLEKYNTVSGVQG